jgi:hypothetical protein
MTSAVPPAGAPHTLGSQPSTECPAAAGQAALAAGRHRGGAGADRSRRAGRGRRRSMAGERRPAVCPRARPSAWSSAPRVARRDPIACSPSEPKRAVELEPPCPCSRCPAATTVRAAVADAPRLAAGVQVVARPIGRSGHPVGPRTLQVGLSGLGRCSSTCSVRRCGFDLVVRSAEPLASGLQDDTRSQVRAARDLAGWAGRVEFRGAELLPLPEARTAADQQVSA